MSRTAAEWERTPALKGDEYVNADVYTDDGLYQEELKRVKQATWKFACHESEIAATNDFRTLEHAGIPIIVARGDDGEIRAFINSCSHRSAMILREPSGNAKFWTCLFHQWTYSNRGECTNITREEGYSETSLCKRGLGLREVRVGVKHGLIFINLSDEAPSFDEFFNRSFEGVESVLSAAPLEVFHYHKAVVRANWKQWHETNLELYHEYLHFVNRKVAMSDESYFEREWKIYPYGHATLTPMQQRYERVKGWATRYEKALPGLSPGEFRLVAFFPDTTILCRTTAMRIDTSTPLAPGLTLIEQRGLGVKDEPPEDRVMRVKHHNQFWGPFGRNFPEDALAIAAVTGALRGGAGRYGIFARHEKGRGQDDVATRAFYKEWSRYMGRPASNPLNRDIG
jgi:methanesulfonate monooxygenase large subunit